MRRVTPKALLLLGLVASALASPAAGDYRFISPGVKLGYTFGKQGGFTGGFEVSYIVWYKNTAHAAVLVVDLQEKMAKYHVGYQISSFAGIELGPTLVLKTDGKPDLGWTATPFIGAVVPYLYYSHTFMFSPEKDIDETGLLLKLPLPLEGHEMDLGFD
jgi:hypothetical protein